MLQSVEVLTNIEEVDQKCYINEDMNGKQLGKFLSVMTAASGNICKSLKGVTFFDSLCI